MLAAAARHARTTWSTARVTTAEVGGGHPSGPHRQAAGGSSKDGCRGLHAGDRASRRVHGVPPGAWRHAGYRASRRRGGGITPAPRPPLPSSGAPPASVGRHHSPGPRGTTSTHVPVHVNGHDGWSPERDFHPPPPRNRIPSRGERAGATVPNKMKYVGGWTVEGRKGVKKKGGEGGRARGGEWREMHAVQSRRAGRSDPHGPAATCAAGCATRQSLQCTRAWRTRPPPRLAAAGNDRWVTSTRGSHSRHRDGDALPAWPRAERERLQGGGSGHRKLARRSNTAHVPGRCKYLRRPRMPRGHTPGTATRAVAGGVRRAARWQRGRTVARGRSCGRRAAGPACRRAAAAARPTGLVDGGAHPRCGHIWGGGGALESSWPSRGEGRGGQRGTAAASGGFGLAGWMVAAGGQHLWWRPWRERRAAGCRAHVAARGAGWRASAGMTMLVAPLMRPHASWHTSWPMTGRSRQPREQGKCTFGRSTDTSVMQAMRNREVCTSVKKPDRASWRQGCLLYAPWRCDGAGGV